MKSGYVVECFEKNGYFEQYGNWAMSVITTILTAHNYIGIRD